VILFTVLPRSQEPLSPDSVAVAQTAPPLSATRTFQLFDSSPDSGNLVTRDVIFDGQKFLSLVNKGQTPGSTPIVGGGLNPYYWVTATTPAGEKLWSYALPMGQYLRLGTHAGMVVIVDLVGESPRLTASRVLLLDPQSGKITDLAPAKPLSNFRYAGDSTFFNLIEQQGEIWTLGDTLSKKVGGITVQPLSVPAPVVQYLQSGNIALATRDGISMALVSASSGYAVEHPINSDVVAASRNYYASASTPPNSKPVILGAIGGDQNGNILGLVNGPAPMKAGAALIQMDSSGNASDIGRIVLPPDASGIPVFPTMRLGLSSELGVVAGNGTVAWYPRAAA
jgi:hypothetical protein